MLYSGSDSSRLNIEADCIFTLYAVLHPFVILGTLWHISFTARAPTQQPCLLLLFAAASNMCNSTDALVRVKRWKVDREV